jgi:hypothetical protein
MIYSKKKTLVPEYKINSRPEVIDEKEEFEQNIIILYDQKEKEKD